MERKFFIRKNNKWTPIEWNDIKKGDFIKQDDQIIGFVPIEDANGKDKIYLEGYYFDPEKFKSKYPIAA